MPGGQGMRAVSARGSRGILLLGGSRQQVVAIEAAKRLGYRTVLCDYLPDNPGRLVADSFHLVSTTDRDAVLEVARAEGVSGVLAYASDPAAATAAYVAQELGLPGNPLRSVEVLSEKHLFRAFLRENGLPCPRAASFSVGERAENVLALVDGWRWPLVVKPTDSSGSKGVTVVGGPDGVADAVSRARGFSRNGVLIAEEYIERSYPSVIGGDVFVKDGEIRFWGLMECLRDEARPLVPAGEKLPVGLPPRDLAAVKDVLQRIVTLLDIRFGELNVEVLVGKGGVPYVLELGARAGGNMIPVQLSDASGVDLVAANVLCAMGEDPGDLEFDGEGRCCAHVVLHAETSGCFAGVQYSDEMAPHVYREVLYVPPGGRAEAFDGADKAVGIAFLEFGDADEMERLFGDVRRHVRLSVEEGPCAR